VIIDRSHMVPANREDFYKWTTETTRLAKLGPGRSYIFYDRFHATAALELQAAFTDLGLTVHMFYVSDIIKELKRGNLNLLR